MKTQLVFPIFIFVPKDNMPYIFWEEKLYKTVAPKTLPLSIRVTLTGDAFSS